MAEDGEADVETASAMSGALMQVRWKFFWGRGGRVAVEFETFTPHSRTLQSIISSPPPPPSPPAHTHAQAGSLLGPPPGQDPRCFTSTTRPRWREKTY